MSGEASSASPAPANDDASRVVDRLRQRFSLAFFLLAALALASYFLIAAGTSDERASAAEINLAGKRRMLSQRIGLLASEALRAPATANADLLAELHESIEQIVRIHETLIDGDAASGIRQLTAPKLRAAYFGPNGLDGMLRAYVSLGQELLAADPADPRHTALTKELVARSRGEMLSAVDRAVGLHQAESERKTDALTLLHTATLFTTLLLLLYLARGLLRPLIARVQGALATSDLTQRALENAVKENRLVLATAGEGLFGVRGDGSISFVNPAAEKMFGLAAAELVGQMHHQRVVGSQTSCPICRLAASGANLQFCDGEFISADGAVFPVEYSLAARPDGDGAIIAFRNVAERRRAELNLVRFQERLVDAIEAMDDAFALFDADDRLSLYNLRFASLFPLPGEVIRLGMSFADLVRAVAENGLYAVAPDRLDSWMAERLDAHRIAQGSSELAFTGERWLHVTERRTREGGTVVIWSDMTTIKRAQLAADAASQAKSDFLARMSHELRTPLNAILGFAQVLEKTAETPLSAGQQECVAHILSGGRHLLGLINEVLDLAAIEAGSLQVESENIELGPLLGECLALIAPLAKDRRIAVHAGSARGLFLNADRKRLKQVLLNLLSNGIKYNRIGGELNVAINASAAGLIITVADTGEGIAPELAAQVFKPFDRLGAKKVEGTGIGLAITRQLVELMGGRIHFRSTPGVGTTFQLDFPLPETSDLVALPKSPPSGASTVPEKNAALPAPPESGAPAALAAETAAPLLAVALSPDDAAIMQLVAKTLRGASLVLLNELDEVAAKLEQTTFRALIVYADLLPEVSERRAASPALAALPLLVVGKVSDLAEQNVRQIDQPLKPREAARILREMLQ